MHEYTLVAGDPRTEESGIRTTVHNLREMPRRTGLNSDDCKVTGAVQFRRAPTNRNRREREGQ